MATDSSSVNSIAAVATTTATNSDSPRHSTDRNSPRSSRNVRAVSSPPWTQIVRGGESEVIAAPAPAPNAPVATLVSPSSPSAVVAEQAAVTSMTEEENAENGNAGKRPVWNKLSNGDVEVPPVMGADLWPPLAQSARASTKSSSDPVKGLSDGSPSFSALQGTGTVSSPQQKHVSNISIPNSAMTNAAPVRQRSTKRNSTNASANSGTPQSPGSQGQVGESHASNPSPRDHNQRSFQPRAANDHAQQQRGSFRNRNGGSGGRRDQERTNQEWNSYRNINGRDAHIQSPRGYPRFLRHAQAPQAPSLPPTSASFIPPPSVRPYGTPMGFPELTAPLYYVPAPPESFRGLPPFVAAPITPHAIFFPPPDLQLHSKILNQIEYYFSNENLVKDTFLRQNMDDQGWVSINLIAGFNKVAQLTDNISLILDAIRSSSIIEVQGNKLRRQNDWMRWIMPHALQFPSTSNPQSFGSPSHEMLATNFQHVSLEENTGYSSARIGSNVHIEVSRSSSSVNLANHLEMENEVLQASVQGNADYLARNSSS